MKALTLFGLLSTVVLAGCAADKSSDIQNLPTPPAKSQIPGGSASNIPPAAQKDMGGK